MKLIKKLLIITFLVSMFASATVKSTKKLSHEVTLLTDENTNPSDYDIKLNDIINPKSTQSLKAI